MAVSFLHPVDGLISRLLQQKAASERASGPAPAAPTAAQAAEDRVSISDEAKQLRQGKGLTDDPAYAPLRSKR